jgi:hypothetical protein
MQQPTFHGVRTMRLTGLILIILAVLNLGILSCQDGAGSRPAPDPSDVIVRGLAAKHGASTGWEENLTYTLQAQERLVTGKPSLFMGYVDDVFHRDGKTYVRFLTYFESPFVFELECSRSIVDTILTQTSDALFHEWAVVAKIQEVSKAVVALEPSADSFGSGEDEVMELEIYIAPSRLFIARGTCIELAYMPYPR